MRHKALILLTALLLLCSGVQASPQQDFIDRIAAPAQAILPGYGLWPSVFIAQSCLESGFGTSYLATEANNYFGRKCGRDPCISVLTPEYRNGIRVLETHYFQIYGSLDEAIHDYAQKYFRKWLSGEPVYRMDASTPFTFVDSVAGTYATDPKYAWKVKSIIYEYDLTKYDQEE